VFNDPCKTSAHDPTPQTRLLGAYLWKPTDQVDAFYWSQMALVTHPTITGHPNTSYLMLVDNTCVSVMSFGMN
jgi:hypothetical protein